jgi:hypothetical protein
MPSTAIKFKNPSGYVIQSIGRELRIIYCPYIGFGAAPTKAPILHQGG